MKTSPRMMPLDRMDDAFYAAVLKDMDDSSYVAVLKDMDDAIEWLKRLNPLSEIAKLLIRRTT